MTTTDEREQPAQAIYSAIQRSDLWTKATGEFRHPEWVGQLVSSVLLGTCIEPVEYVALGAADSTSLRAFVFTTSFVAIVDVVPDRASETMDAGWSVRVVGLSSLRRMEVRASVDAFDTNRTWIQWPGSPSAVLHFKDEEPINIPIAQPNNATDRAGLVATVRRLPGFLR